MRPPKSIKIRKDIQQPSSTGLRQTRGRKRAGDPDPVDLPDKMEDVEDMTLGNTEEGRKKAKRETTGLKPKETIRRSASQLRSKRSNSKDRKGLPLSHEARNRAGEENASLARADMNDFSVIAVYSREAYENFGKAFKVRMNSESPERATQLSRKGVSPEHVSSMLGLQSRSEIGTGFRDQIQALIENKTIPHVIAVIEGKEEQSGLALGTRLEDKSINLGYTRAEYFQGLNANGSNDNKQSMSFYVRDDMKNAYRFTQETIEGIPCVGVDYKTTNYQTGAETNYRSLVVHIPNKFIGTSFKERNTHQVFENYAEKAANQPSPIIVTGYLGDTNFKNPMDINTAPSMGGHIPSDGIYNSQGTLTPQSSSAKHDTNFMQSVPLGKDQSRHSVLQPATLNSVFLSTDAQNREATDHPSMIHFTAHKDEISGRDPAVNSEYYLPVKAFA